MGLEVGEVTILGGARDEAMKRFGQLCDERAQRSGPIGVRVRISGHLAAEVRRQRLLLPVPLCPQKSDAIGVET
jgi:hypothetical protein